MTLQQCVDEFAALTGQKQSIPCWNSVRPQLYDLFVLESGPAMTLLSHYYFTAQSGNATATTITRDPAEQAKWCKEHLPYFSSVAKYLRRMRNKLVHREVVTAKLLISSAISVIDLSKHETKAKWMLDVLLMKLEAVFEIILCKHQKPTNQASNPNNTQDFIHTQIVKKSEHHCNLLISYIFSLHKEIERIFKYGQNIRSNILNSKILCSPNQLQAQLSRLLGQDIEIPDDFCDSDRNIHYNQSRLLNSNNINGNSNINSNIDSNTNVNSNSNSNSNGNNNSNNLKFNYHNSGGSSNQFHSTENINSGFCHSPPKFDEDTFKTAGTTQDSNAWTSPQMISEHKQTNMRERLKGCRVRVETGKWIGTEGIFRSWNGSNAYIDLDGHGRVAVSARNQISILLSSLS